MRALAAILALAAALLTGCGGASSAGAVSPSPRADLLFGYYGGCASTILENAGHVNAHWATGWCGSGTWHLDVAQELAHARGAGVRHVVLALPHGLVWQPGAEAEVRFQIARLQQSGALEGWDSIMVYPADEPEIAENGARSHAEVTAMLGWLRPVLRGSPALQGAPVGVIYSCSSGRRPGMAAYDWVGCDDYAAGCAVAAPSGAYDDLARALRPGQRLLVVAGGADPWRQDPGCFEARAHGDARVAMLVAFIWQDRAAPGVGAGIRSNGLRGAWCRAGWLATGRKGGC